MKTLDVVVQVPLAELILNIAERASKHKDRETLSDLSKFLVPLFYYLEKAEVSFINLNEYIFYLDDIILANKNYTLNKEDIEQLEYLEKTSLRFRSNIES